MTSAPAVMPRGTRPRCSPKVPNTPLMPDFMRVAVLSFEGISFVLPFQFQGALPLPRAPPPPIRKLPFGQRDQPEKPSVILAHQARHIFSKHPIVRCLG